MSELKIEKVDPFDEGAVAAWRDVVRAVGRHEIGDHSTMWTLPELLVTVQVPAKHKADLLYSGMFDGQLVVAGWITLPLLDNLSAADLAVHVRPEVRRRGFGSQMLEVLERVVREEHGRSRFDALTEWAYDGPSDGAGTSGVEFGRAHGYAFGLGDVQREVLLPVDEGVLAEVGAEAAPYASGYQLRTWAGPVPGDIVQSYVELSSTLMTEAPMGDNEREPEAVDIEAYRTMEGQMAAQKRTTWHTVALAPDGRVVAFTDLAVPEHDQEWVFQWGTLVSPEHRGHRLGLAVKIANLQALQASGTADGRRLVTWNAEVNDHMIGINHQMGFVPTARAGELQKKLA